MKMATRGLVALTAFAAVATASSSFQPLPHARLAAPKGPQRARHLALLSSWSDFRAPAAGDPSINPWTFGADPTGVNDSTAAWKATLAALFNATDKQHPLANGIANCGGATVDLGGGTYLISEPISIPQNYGNFRFVHGTFRVSPTFPASRYVIEVGGGACNNSQKSCNQDLGFEGLFIDGMQVAAGGISISDTMGANIGPQMFILNFTSVGILLAGGHEGMIHETWLGEWMYDSKNKESGPASTATGILITGNDHYVQNCIVFSSHYGLTTSGAANIITGVRIARHQPCGRY